MQYHWKSAGAYSTVGLELVISILIGLFAGQWLDKRFDGDGVWSIFGFVVGLIAGGRALYRALKRANREAEEYERRAQQEQRDYLDDNRKQ